MREGFRSSVIHETRDKDLEVVRLNTTQRAVLILFRLFFGLLTLAAIITQLTIQVHLGFSVVNFFSYFTNLSNIFALVVLLMSAVFLIQRREQTPTFDLVRGASVVGMALVGIVFGVLLRDEDLGSLLPWVNFVLHYVMPVVMIVDWLYQPPKTRLTFSQTWVWLIFPFLYLVYSLIRGSIVSFYAYPFFNPAKSGGYGGVALYCVAILVVFLILIWLIMLLGNWRRRNIIEV